MKDNIILIAATNRPDILDPALLRPGRFDRQITVDRPDRKGRARILAVHTRGKPLARAIDLDKLAGQTPGFTGADLSNLVNEAALLAARRGEREISAIARGQALGYTISLPTEDKFLTTRAELRDTMAMTLGGRAAEEIVFSEVTTGASNDLEKVTATAKQMVMRFGMSDKLGPRVFGHDQTLPFLGREFSSEPDYSDDVAREIDDEIRRIVEAAHQVAKDMLLEHRESLTTISELLLKRETIESVEFEQLLAGKPAEEVFGPDDPALGPGAPERPEVPSAADRAAGKLGLPRPGLAGGAAEARGLELPEKPELA